MTSLAPPAGSSAAARGALAAGLCYLLWGLVPLYWRQLSGVSALELIAHRHLWSFALVALIVLAQGGQREVFHVFADRRSAARCALAAGLLTANWLVYVWGVNSGRVIETSLGYFLVPLVNVAVGRLVLHEHLRRLQWIAVAAAGLGVLLMCFGLGHPPWIALVLAGTWGGYGLMRKQSTLGAVTGLAAETLVLLPAVVAFLAWQHHLGVGALGRLTLGRHVLLLGSGIITAIPLLLFAYGARRIRLATLGLLQYLAPSVQFALGVWHFHEPLAPDRILAFAFIWTGLALYTADNLLASRRTGVTRASAPPAK